MFAITYSLRFLQPVIVSMLDPGDENAAHSLKFVPGSVMRGALAMRYIASHNLANAAQDAACRALFFDEETLYLDALPTDNMGKRTLPTPLSWFTDKTSLADWLEDKSEDLVTRDAGVDPAALQKLEDAKPVVNHARFYTLAEGDAQTFSPQEEMATHIRRPHKLRGIKAQGERAIFTYMSLAADQVMAGVVLCKTQRAALNARDLLKSHPQLTIGRSRSAGYGQVSVENVSDPIANWTETGVASALPQPVLDDDEIHPPRYIVTLASYALLRDANGQFTSDLGAWLGAAKTTSSFRKMELMGGYNRKWGLPVLQCHALCPGSVFVFEADQVDKTKLLDALQNGVGSRRNDGFGRIAVNAQTQDHIKLIEGIAKKSPALAPRPRQAQTTLHVEKIIADAALRRELDHGVAKRAIKTPIHKPPSNAALSRIMLAARQAAFAKDMTPLKNLLAEARGEMRDKDKKSRKPVQVALEKARIDNMPLGEWLGERVEKCDIETQLQSARVKDHEMTLGSYKPEITPAMRVEYTAILIERITKLAIKNDKKEGAQ